MAEAPKRRETAAPERKTVERKAPEKRESLGVGERVEYSGMTATVTGESKATGRVYLDTPVCAWVPVAECAKA